jgi:AcrR family transcriptional regulator
MAMQLSLTVPPFDDKEGLFQQVELQRMTTMLEQMRPALLGERRQDGLVPIRQRLASRLQVIAQCMQLAFSHKTGIALIYLNMSHREDAVCAGLAALLPCLNSMTSSLRAIVIHLTCGDGAQSRSSESSVEAASRAASRLRALQVPITMSISSGLVRGAARRITSAANYVIAAYGST